MKRWAIVAAVMLGGCASLAIGPAGLAGTWRAAEGRELVIAPEETHEPDGTTGCWKEKGATVRFLWPCVREGVPVYWLSTLAVPQLVCNVAMRRSRAEGLR